MNTSDSRIPRSALTSEMVDSSETLNLELDGLRPRTAHEIVYRSLRRAIIHGELLPGTKLNQSAVARSLHVSTTPVREALSRLAADGLVQNDAHRGAIVRGFDENELVEIYEIRQLLEPLAIRKAAEHITDAALARAEELCDLMEDHSDPQAWAENNRLFHSVIVSAAKSPNLQTILTTLQDKSTYYVHLSLTVSPDRFRAANEHHREILAALRERDGEKAAAIESAHLKATLTALNAQRRPPSS